jgi:hypothetical protein
VLDFTGNKLQVGDYVSHLTAGYFFGIGRILKISGKREIATVQDFHPYEADHLPLGVTSPEGAVRKFSSAQLSKSHQLAEAALNDGVPFEYIRAMVQRTQNEKEGSYLVPSDKDFLYNRLKNQDIVAADWNGNLALARFVGMDAINGQPTLEYLEREDGHFKVAFKRQYIPFGRTIAIVGKVSGYHCKLDGYCEHFDCYGVADIMDIRYA